MLRSEDAGMDRDGLAQATQEQDREGVLRLLLDAWAATRDPDLAGCIEQLGADLDRCFEPLPARGPALEAAWLELASHKRSATLGVLLQALDGATTGQLRQMLPLLEGFPPDPRLTRPLLLLLGKFTSTSARPALNRAVDLLVSAADPRCAGLADLKPVGPAERLVQCMADFDAPTPLSPSDRSALDALVPLLQRWTQGPPAALEPTAAPVLAVSLDAVYADPENLEIRRVVGDALLEAGQVRGEFIALQFLEAEGRAKPPQLKRMRDLSKQDGAAWMGPVATCLKAPVFRYGFVHSGALHLPRGCEAALDAPEWSTIEALDLTELASNHAWRAKRSPAAFFSARTPLLRRLTSVPQYVAESTLASDGLLHLRALEGCGYPTRANLEAQRKAWIDTADGPGARNLTTLHFALDPQDETDRAWSPGPGLAWLQGTALGTGLEELGVRIRDRAPPLAELEALLATLSLKRLVFETGCYRFSTGELIWRVAAGSHEVELVLSGAHKQGVLARWALSALTALKPAPGWSVVVRHTKKPTRTELEALDATLVPLLAAAFSDVRSAGEHA